MSVLKQLEVQIMGQNYLLSCPEGGESRLLDAVEKVDTAMCKIRDAGKVKARDRIAVLAALNLAFDVPERVTAAPPAFHASSFAGLNGNGNGSSHDAFDGIADPRLSALMARLDGTLGGDGQLL